MLWSPLLCHTSVEKGLKLLTTYESGVQALIKMKLWFHPLNQDTCVHMAVMLFYIISNLNKSCTFFEYLLMYIIAGPRITGKWHKFHWPVKLFCPAIQTCSCSTEDDNEGVFVWLTVNNLCRWAPLMHLKMKLGVPSRIRDSLLSWCIDF